MSTLRVGSRAAHWRCPKIQHMLPISPTHDGDMNRVPTSADCLLVTIGLVLRSSTIASY